MYKVAYYQHFENNESSLTHSNEKFLRQMLKIEQTYGYKDIEKAGDLMIILKNMDSFTPQAYDFLSHEF